MKNKIVTHYYVKEARMNKNGKAPIYLRITVNGERAEISTNKKINPSDWDKASEKAVGRSEEARTINSTLTTLLGKVEKYYSALNVKDEVISVNLLINELRGKGQNQMTLIQAYEYYIDKIKALKGIEFANSTIDKYEYSLNSIKRFLINACHKSDIRLFELDHSFIERYNLYLRRDGNLKHNSAVKNIKNLIRVINVAIINKWLNTNPFKGFNCSYINPRRDSLSTEEIELLVSKKFNIKRLEKIKDVFIFQIYTGLSFIDMSGLNKDNIETGIDGNLWLVVHRRKTGTRSSIPILPRALEVLEKYKADPYCLANNQILPVCSNQRMNGYLKEIANICGIKKNLTTHLARHTFATTITLTNGVPIETVSKMLGHSDLRSTQIYSKVVDKKIANDMKYLMGKNEKRISK